MKLLALLPVVLIAFTSFTQIAVPEKKEPCYKKADTRKGKKFAEWECGKIAGIVDCNEKLELDEGSNTVITVSGKAPFTGICETCHSNGILERRVTFVNGKQNGPDTTNYASGCLMVIRNHVQGAENGKWIYYYDSLQVPAWEMNYSVGQKHGPQIYFNKKGDTTRYENYLNGILNGPKVTYDEKGKRIKQVTYVKGLMDGPFLVYNPAGKVIEDVTYKAGKKNGVFKYYYDDGVLLSTENWNMDVRNGEFKTFYYEGFIQKTENYKKGLKEGAFEEYFPDQKIKRRAVYKKDVLVEEHVYNEAGTETKTFGALPTAVTEDDAVPNMTPSKKKKKKSKKPEEPAGPAAPTN